MSNNLIKLIEAEFEGDLQDDAKRLLFTAIKKPRSLNEVVKEILGVKEEDMSDADP